MARIQQYTVGVRQRAGHCETPERGARNIKGVRGGSGRRGREKDGKSILCKSERESKELYIKIDKSVCEYECAGGSAYAGDPTQTLWEALDIGTKSTVMQKGL